MRSPGQSPRDSGPRDSALSVYPDVAWGPAESDDVLFPPEEPRRRLSLLRIMVALEAGEIYQARWFNSGDDPAAIVQYSYQTPWELLGPVLPADRAPKVAPQAGHYPAWSRSTQNSAGLFRHDVP